MIRITLSSASQDDLIAKVSTGSGALVQWPLLEGQQSERHDLSERQLSETALCAVNGRDGRKAELAGVLYCKPFNDAARPAIPVDGRFALLRMDTAE